MNCIFCCVFTQEKFVDMFYLLLESIFIYGNLDNNTHILIYTSTLFLEKIKTSKFIQNLNLNLSSFEQKISSFSTKN